MTEATEPVLLEETKGNLRILTLNRAPLASAQTKRLVARAGLLADLEQHLRDELELARRALTSQDGREAVKAIFEKRKPEFTGR